MAVSECECVFFRGAECAGVSQECLKGSKLSQALCLRMLPKDVAVDVLPSKGLFRDKGGKKTGKMWAKN